MKITTCIVRKSAETFVMKGTLIILCVLIALALAQHNHHCNDKSDCSNVVCGHNEAVHCTDGFCVCTTVHGKRQVCHEHQHCTCNDGTVSVCGADGTCVCHDHGNHGVGKK
ncbi:hypothetical protein CHS0354_030709 [Potamilus streckersoni]|uniref:Uncharacterized protein n=1 Tax=Potamilus streckersoni TaxID=2493646 RepID=A0AAE0SMR4_9BIVA|nr:hypothetical protein CHS0354_030709 [Potamilus streckersoni]